MLKATTVPITIALEAMVLERINEAIMATAAVTDIRVAGTITHGTSFANHARVCMVIPLSGLFQKAP